MPWIGSAVVDRLQVRWSGGTRTFDGDRVLIGREPDCDIRVTDGEASRRHATLHREGGRWTVVDSSSNGTFVDGRRIDRLPVTTSPVTLRLGAPDGESVSVVSLAAPSEETRLPIIPPGQLAHGQTIASAELLRSGRSLTIGRDPNNDIVLDDPLVSRHHARLDPAGLQRPAVLHDLGSFNGTFVDGSRLHGDVELAIGAEVIFGNQTFRWDGLQLLASATTHEFTLYADGITTVLPDGRKLLQDATFQLGPSSLTAVIGPSGAGKSTMLGALTGLRPATQGRVIWHGHDLYEHYDQLRFQIGLVPQQDIQHPQLKVQQALDYAAKLRLPPDTTATERTARVRTVAEQLQLIERLDNQIGTQLSGGQRKRVSIATELLTAPPLLFLDEPTSGLDPGLDLEVMKQLRSLADGGRVVVVVTHSVLALDLCDNIMVLAPGGKIAYFGPPDGVLPYFRCSSYPEVFDLLDKSDLWQRIPARTPSAGPVAAPVVNNHGEVPAPPSQSLARQFATLVSRNIAVVKADRLLLGMLVLLPLILGGLSRLVPGENGLSLDATSGCPAGTEQVAEGCRRPDGSIIDLIFYAGEANQRLIVLIVAACLMGTAIAIRELIGERPIFQREYAVGLSTAAYFASKVLVLGVAAFIQGLVVTFIATAGLPGPDSTDGVLRVALAIGALAFTMAVVGLALSALVTSTEQTMPALVGVVMLQLVLSGALFEIAGRQVLEQIAWLSPSRWAYAASASTLDLVRGQQERDTEDWISLAGADHYLMDLGVLGLLGLVYLGLGFFLVRRSATKE